MFGVVLLAYKYTKSLFKFSLFLINKFHPKNILRNKHTYLMINASNEGICVDLCKKTKTQPLFTCFQIGGKYHKSFKTYLLNIIFDDFFKWLLGYKTEFSCLYLPQGHTIISTVWLWNIDKFVIFWFWVKVHL